MKSMQLHTAALLLIILSAVSASAADVTITYRVDAKVLKRSTPAGTPLSFQLFTDSTCATPAGPARAASVEAVTLIEQPKLIRIKGGPRPPSVAEIRYTVTGITPQAVFYAQVTGTGIVPVGSACQLQMASVGGTVPPPPLSCPPDSALSGSACMDKYEASLWDIPPGALTVIQHVEDGTVTLAELIGAGATELALAGSSLPCAPSIPSTFPLDGNYTAPLYAVSVAGVLPTACVSAYQAEAACALSGKRLPSNTEWTRAAQGTPRAFADDGTTSCNVQTTNAPLTTGSRSACVSTAGVYDMLGNVWEWTQEPGTWIRGGSWILGSDASIQYAAGSTAAVPSDSNFRVGFRCAR